MTQQSGNQGLLPPGVEAAQRMTAMAWAQERTERRDFALRMAQDPTVDVFRSWRFANTPLAEVALRALVQTEPSVGPTTWALVVPEPSGSPQTRRVHERGLVEQAPREEDALAGRIALLDWAGREVEDRERGVWERTWTADPAADAEIATIWSALVSGQPWSVREAVERVWLPFASRSFAAVLAAREVPREVQRRVLADLREGFFYRLIGNGEGPPGWAEIAVRVVETTAPVEGPAAVLSAGGREQAGRCLAGRAGWGRTLQRVWPDRPDRSARALEAEATLGELAAFEQLLDLHTVLRLIDTGPARPDEAWRIIVQNRGKARGRLRALVSAQTAWLPALLALDALAERSRVALARYAWSWAWQELAHDFPFDVARPTTPPCAPLAEGLLPLSADERAPLATWVLLVLLKGRGPHLVRWVHQGGTGDRDSTWARLLGGLPGGLSGAASYPRVRHALRDGLPEVLAGHRAVLEALAGFPVDRRLKKRVLELLAPGWHPDVPVPKSGFPTFVAHARDALFRLAEDPACP